MKHQPLFRKNLAGLLMTTREGHEPLVRQFSWVRLLAAQLICGLVPCFVCQVPTQRQCAGFAALPCLLQALHLNGWPLEVAGHHTADQLCGQ